MVVEEAFGEIAQGEQVLFVFGSAVLGVEPRGLWRQHPLAQRGEQFFGVDQDCERHGPDAPAARSCIFGARGAQATA